MYSMKFPRYSSNLRWSTINTVGTKGEGGGVKRHKVFHVHVCCVIMPYVYSSGCVRVNARASVRENPHVLSFCAACNSLSWIDRNDFYVPRLLLCEWNWSIQCVDTGNSPLNLPEGLHCLFLQPFSLTLSVSTCFIPTICVRQMDFAYRDWTLPEKTFEDRAFADLNENPVHCDSRLKIPKLYS